MTGSVRTGMTAMLLVGTACASCLRAPIREYRDAGASGGRGSTSRADDDSTDSSDGSDSTTRAPDERCHPSYQPCLPIVDELNCPEVVALGAAPVTVIGPDVYGLDSDNDGIGCEN